MSDHGDRLNAALAGRYQIEREIGQGGMATVYLARDVKHDRKVALKVLRPDLAATLGPDRFLREVRIAANLQHPHVLPLYDSGEADGFLYYVMPFVDGESLRAKLDRAGELPVSEAVRILKEVTDALAYAHEQGVVHRDIKPDNVMLSGRHALVTDFGVAKAVSEATGRQQITTAGVALGTPAYMAPEQAAADPHVDHRADIYALGAMAYELLAGRPPFTGKTPQQVLSAHVTMAPEPVTAHRAAVPLELANLVMRCLEKKPADRWQSADDLLPQFEAMGTSSAGITPVETRPVSAISDDTAAVRRRNPGLLVGVIGAVAVVALVAFALLRSGGPPVPGAANGRPMLVVLPFDNLGAPDDEYFADGITEEITSRLAQVSGLGVVSRQSAGQYKDSDKSLREIGQELRVQYVLEGTIRTERVPSGTGQVRVTPQLIRVSDDTHLWADRYTADLVPGELFAIQATIAEQVASALGVTLLGSERQDVASRPTENLEAYEAYLRGLEHYQRSYDEADLRAAEVELRRAVSLDPEFALAYAALSHVHNNLFWFSYDISPTRAALSRAAAERALAIDSTLPEAHIAMGEYLYHGERDYNGALREFAIALPRRPNDANLYRGMGAVQRRQGRWDEALANFRKVADELNPRSAVDHWEAGSTAQYMRRYDLAEQHYRRVIALEPSRADGYLSLATIAVLQSGDVASARRWADDAAREAGPNALVTGFASQLAGGVLLYASPELRAAILPLPRSAYDAPFQYDLFRALLYLAAADSVRARALFDSARVALEGLASQGTAEFQAGIVYPLLAQTYAYLSRGDEAVTAVRRALQLLPVEKDALIGNGSRLTLAMVYATLGQAREAVAELEDLLQIPSAVSRAALRVDPVWEPIRGDPAFQRLLGGGQ